MITGAAGFVGQHVTAALGEAGFDPAEIYPFAGPADTAAGAREMALEDPHSVRAAVGAVLPTAVIHLAAIAAPREARADARRAWAVNFDGVRLIAEALLEFAPSAKLVFAGSSEAYGESFDLHAGAPLSESAPLRPRTTYAATKAAADIYVGQRTFDGLDALRFRAFNHTGPGQRPDFVIPSFARQIALIERGALEPVLLVGNLDAERDFVDARDVARAYVSGLGAPPVVGEASALNLCSGRAWRIGDLLDILLSKSSARIRVETDPSLLRSGETPKAVGDNRRAEGFLGWRPEIAMTTTLADVLDDWRARVARSDPGAG